MINLFAIVIAAIVLGGLGLLAELRRVEQPQDWPRVTGRITASQMTGRDGRSRRLRLEYKYTVDGELYYGSSDLMGVDADTQEAADRLGNCYRAGCPVRVAYDPQRPWLSHVDDDLHRRSRPALLLASLLVMLLGVLSLVGLALDVWGR